MTNLKADASDVQVTPDYSAMTKADLQKLIADTEAAAKAEISAIEAAILAKEQEIITEVETWAQNFRTKHGLSVQMTTAQFAAYAAIIGLLVWTIVK